MTVTCDGCQDKLEMQAKTWGDGIAQMKAKGWRLKLIDGVWKHGCPACIAFKQKSTTTSLAARIALVTGGKGKLVMPDWDRFLYYARMNKGGSNG